MVHWGSVACDPPTPMTEEDGYFRSMLIDLSGMVGLSKVTEGNIEEWLWRVAFLRRVLGDKNIGQLVYGGKELRRIPLDPSVLRRWVGLWTNWSSTTRPAFVRQYMDDMANRITRQVRADMEEPRPKYRGRLEQKLFATSGDSRKAKSKRSAKA